MADFRSEGGGVQNGTKNNSLPPFPSSLPLRSTQGSSFSFSLKKVRTAGGRSQGFTDIISLFLTSEEFTVLRLLW